MTKPLIKRILATEDPYAILGVAPGCSAEAARTSHRSLARMLHPDRCSLPGASDAMARVNVAYETVTDPQRRKRHDTIAGTAKRACTKCGGSGAVAKQKGFQAKVRVTCPYCHGTGHNPSA